MAKDYILYLNYTPRRPLPRPRRRPSWPPPAIRQGPYWVEPAAQGLCCTPRRGTRAYQRMLKRQHENETFGWFILFLFLFWLVVGLAAVVQCRF